MHASTARLTRFPDYRLWLPGPEIVVCAFNMNTSVAASCSKVPLLLQINIRAYTSGTT